MFGKTRNYENLKTAIINKDVKEINDIIGTEDNYFLLREFCENYGSNLIEDNLELISIGKRGSISYILNKYRNVKKSEGLVSKYSSDAPTIKKFTCQRNKKINKVKNDIHEEHKRATSEVTKSNYSKPLDNTTSTESKTTKRKARKLESNNIKTYVSRPAATPNTNWNKNKTKELIARISSHESLLSETV